MWATMLLGKTAFKVAFVFALTVLVTLPDGRARDVRERWFLRVAWVVVAFPPLVFASNEFLVTSDFAFPGVADIRSPLFIAALAGYGRAFAALDALTYSLLLGAVWLLVLRYRAARTRERKQIRWVLFAGVAAILVGVIPTLLGEIGVIPKMGDALGDTLLRPRRGSDPGLACGRGDRATLDRRGHPHPRSFVYGALSRVILLVYIGVAAAVGVAGGTAGTQRRNGFGADRRHRDPLPTGP